MSYVKVYVLALCVETVSSAIPFREAPLIKIKIKHINLRGTLRRKL